MSPVFFFVAHLNFPARSCGFCQGHGHEPDPRMLRKLEPGAVGKKVRLDAAASCHGNMYESMNP